MTFKNRLTSEDWTRFIQLTTQQLSPRTKPSSKFRTSILIALLLALMLAPMLIFSFSKQAGEPAPPQEGIHWGWAVVYAIPVLILLVLPKLLPFFITPASSLKEDGVVLGNRTISTEPVGIRITTNGSETLLSWSALDSIHVTDDMLLIYMEPLVAYCVVRHACTPAEFDAFLNEIRTHAPQVRDSQDSIAATS